MNIIQKIKELDLMPGQYVVIGSGILGVLGIRESNDIDIVVLPSQHEKLRETGEWEEYIKYEKTYLRKDVFEIVPHLPFGNYKTTTEEELLRLK